MSDITKVTNNEIAVLEMIVTRLKAQNDRVNSWIVISPKNNKFPREGKEVLVSIRDDSGDHVTTFTAVGMMIGSKWIVDKEIRNDVVAWQSFPEPLSDDEYMNF